MSELDLMIEQNRQATAAVVARASAIPADKWTVPRGPGKWSPAQVVEHITKSAEGHRKLVQGVVTGSTGLKAWLARTFFLPRLFKAGDFTQQGLKSPKFIEPSDVPAPQNELLPRLESAVAGLETDLRAAVAAGKEKVTHTFFGPVPLEDMLHFVLIHTRHHEPQIVAAP